MRKTLRDAEAPASATRLHFLAHLDLFANIEHNGISTPLGGEWWMWVVSLKRLREFWNIHSNAETPLRGWYTQTSAAEWRNFSDLRTVFPSADLVGNCTVFNVGGNKFRLIARLFYRSHKVYVLRVMTHREYDRDDWPNECGCYSGPPARKRPRRAAPAKKKLTENDKERHDQDKSS
jgi:mRNA interferase HigB